MNHLLQHLPGRHERNHAELTLRRTVEPQAPHVAIECAELLICIWEISGSNFESEIGISGLRIVLNFLHFLQIMPHLLKFIIH
jgi:hypothetical protein